MKVKEFLKETYDVHPIYPGSNYDIQSVRPWIMCADGFYVSIQAGSTTYSIPRANVEEFEAVELGYPSMADDLILPYAADFDSPTETVYGYVPIDIVEQLVEKHGGIVRLLNREDREELWWDRVKRDFAINSSPIMTEY